MKKIVILFVVFSMVLLHFSEVIAMTTNVQQRSQEEIKAVATELYNRINIQKPELAQAVSAYQGGRYLDFLKNIRNMIMDNMYQKGFERFMWQSESHVSEYQFEAADVMIGKTSFEDFNAKYSQWPLMKALPEWGVLGDPYTKINPDFMAEPINNDNGYLNFSAFIGLATRFWKKGEVIYLHKWEQIMEAYSDNYFVQGRKLLETVPVSLVTDMRPLDYGYSSALCASWRISFILLQMSLMVKSLPGTGEKTTHYMESLDAIDGKLAPESYDVFDPVSVCKIILCMERDHFDYAYKSYIDIVRPEVPNQILASLSGMANIIRVADFFTSIDAKRAGLDKKIMTYFSDYVHKDGGHSEQSFNYNTLSVHEFGVIKSYAKENSHINPQLSKINYMLDNSDKLFNSLGTPLGRLPNVGGGFAIPPYRAWESDELYKKAFEFGDGEGMPFALPYEFKHFTSIAFPYAGYYAMRSGWDKDNTYLFTQNARRTFGHMYVSNNSIELISKRRNLIMSGGLTPYTAQDIPEDVRSEWRNWVAYFGEDANMSRSTVIVDGLPQARGTNIWVSDTLSKLPSFTPVKGGVSQGVGKFSTIDSKWSDSDTFTYHEGLYDVGYIASQDVSHYREIIMIKPLDLVLISDIMGMPKGENHDITQVWCFPPYLDKKNSDIIVPGFKENEVNYDVTNRLLKTQDPTGPNVFLKNFSNYSVDYKKYYGFKKENDYYLGWYSPGVRGYRWPKVDMHLNYKANENTTPLVSAISSSYTLEEVVKDYENLSTDKYSGFKGVSDGNNIIYLSAKNPQKMNGENISLTAKTFVSVSNGETIKGIVTDCSSFIFKGEAIKLDSPSFEFEIIGNNFKIKKNIEYASSFKWVDYKNGSAPVIDMFPEDKVLKIAKNLVNYSQRITTVNYNARSYTLKNLDSATNYAIQHINTILRAGSSYSQDELVKSYLSYINFAKKEIGTWQSVKDKQTANTTLNRLAQELENVINTVKLDENTYNQLSAILSLFK